MYVWDKVVHKQDDFPVAAKELASSVVTNGSFNEYSGGNKYWAEIKVNVGCMWKAFGLMIRSVTTPGSAAIADKEFHDYSEKTKKKNFTGSKAEGHVIGTREGINETALSRPTLHHFGRKAGRSFDDYVIEKGDPQGLAEVIGGLFRNVEAYHDAEVKDQTIGCAFWGLAPLSKTDPNFSEAGLGDALDDYQAHDGLSGTANPPLNGLLIAAAGWEDVRLFAKLFIAARVRDVVRLDGNDSILLGHGSVLLHGEHMRDEKRLYNRWGYQCRAG